MIIDERLSQLDRAMQAAGRMITAARTAPKARGIDILEACILTGDDITRLSEAMLDLHRSTGRPVYERDAANILKAQCIVLIGTHRQLMGLNCGHCGFPTCAAKPAEAPCAMNVTDVGIAIGSACAAASDCKVDTRVMFSAGMGAMRLDLLPGCTQVFAIPVAIASKNPFFDR
ncbi:MAG: ferredoxin [Muribaculaceae bacterium]|nr:ferredoxin [Muribaculaceae bacterium]